MICTESTVNRDYQRQKNYGRKKRKKQHKKKENGKKHSQNVVELLIAISHFSTYILINGVSLHLEKAVATLCNNFRKVNFLLRKKKRKVPCERKERSPVYF